MEQRTDNRKQRTNILRYLTPNTFLKRARLSRKLYYYTVVGILLVAGGTTVLIQMLFPTGAEAAWFNNNWAYRQTINISAHTAAEKNVYINVNGGGSSTQVKVGTYTGNGTSQSISTVGFQPAFVFIKGNNASTAVMSTDAMGANKTKPLTGNTAAGTGMITSIDAGGFSVGSDATVNTNTTTYYYLAIADTNGTNFKTFSYSGTGVAHDITDKCGFTPDLVIVGGDGATATVFRSSHSSTDSNLFNGSNSATRLTGFVTNGFSVGTSSTVNTNTATYYGICAKAAANLMATKKYTGNSTDNTDITGLGFQPDFTLTKKLDTSDVAAIRFKDNAGDNSVTALGGNAADRIQSFLSDGFQVGTDICCNNSTSEYNSFSFKESAGGGAGPAIDTSDTTKFQSDCGDLRFTDAAGNLLPYYIVSGCGTSSTHVHIFMEDFPSGEQNIYMYYGNPSAPNGFSGSDFSTEASNYTINSIGSEEVGAAAAAYWKFDEGAGTIAKDSSGGGSNGTLTGATLPAWTANQCVSQKCLAFNGITSNVSVSRTVSGVKTIAFWVNPSSSNSGELMTLNSTTHVRATTGSITVPGSTSPTIYVNGVVNGTISANTWNHVEVTTSTAISASAITLGKGPLGVLNGYMDEVRLYNYARSATQVKADVAGAGGVLGAKDQSFLTKGLVGYWKMDETTANSCSGGSNDNCDSSGNGSDGAWNGDATASMSAKFGAGTVYDGTGDYISGLTSSTLKPTSALTVSVWMKASATNTNARLVSANSTQNIGYDITLVAGSPTFNIAPGGVQSTLSAGTSVLDNTWHHIVATYDGVYQRIFIDGRLKNSNAATGAITYGAPTLIIAANNSASPANFYTGVLDDVRVYNRGLSSSEVEALYNTAPGPVMRWGMEEGQGSTTSDVTGNGNTATFAGSGGHWGQGKYGKGGTFNGSDDTLTVPDSTHFDNWYNGSFGFWIRPSQSLSGGGILQSVFNKNASNSNNGDVLCGLMAGNIFRCSFDRGSSVTLSLDTTKSAPVNQWTYISYTWSNDGTDTTFTSYVNGAKDSSGTLSADVMPLSSTVQFVLGNTDFKGSLDEVSIYNYTRSAKQIIESMNASHPAGGSPVGSMLGLWHFDGGSGNVASNSGILGGLANGNMFNFSSPPSNNSGWSNNGKFGKALNFDGADDIVEAGSDSGFDDMSSLTISAWVNPRTTGEINLGRIFDKANATTPTNGWVFNMNSSRQLTFGADFTGVDLNVLTSTAIPLGVWSHVTVTWDGSATAANVHIYINGKESASYVTQTSGTGSRVTDAAEQLKIGNDKTRARTFDGWIDEAKVYNYVLSPSEVRVDYNRGGGLKFGSLGTDIDGKTASDSASRMYCPPGDTTAVCASVGEWRFEEKNGNIATDSSANGNDGTLTNSPQYSIGKVGSGLTFVSGSSQSVDVGNTINGVKTISYWVKPTSTTSNMVALTGSAYVTATTGTISATGFTSPTIYVNGVASTTLTANVWQKVTVTTGTGINSSAIKFGLANGTYFNGSLDEIKFYNYAMNAAQVSWDYNRGQPVSWYKFDECQGATVNDSSGNGRVGAINLQSLGVTTTGTCGSSGAWANGGQGKFNYALDLDGSDDYVSIASPNLPTGDFTYSGWVNLGSNTDENFLLAADGSGGDEFRVYINGSNKVLVYTNNTLQLTSARSVATGTWTDIVVTRSGSTIKLYLNGQQDTSTGSDGVALSFSTCSLLVGVDASATCATGTLDKYLDGKVDEVQIYNYALTTPQIQLLYNQNSAVRFGPSTGTP